MKRPSVRLNTIVACFLTVAAVGAAPAMQAGQGVVTGLVTDALTGVPIPGAVVTVSPGGVAAVTNAAGGYQVIVPAGTISLTAAAPNRPVQSIFGVIVTNGGETTVNFAVSLPGGTGVLTGHVRNAATNPPVGIAGATVTVSPGGMSTASDATGRYQITLPVGTYAVTAVLASYETAAASGVKVSNQIATTQDLQLPPKGAGSGALDVLHAFAPSADGISPVSLIQATDGDFYGTTTSGGQLGHGTIFRMTPAGAFTVLHAFAGGVGGGYPTGLVQGTDGDFYGTTGGGGASGFGTAFRMTPDGTVTILHEFAGGADAKYPSGALVQDTHGDFYGTSSGTGSGEVFKMTRDGTIAWVHAFSNALPDGRYPSGQLVVAADGNLYGTTFQGGTSGQGTVFRITPDGTFTRLYSFTGGSDGGFPATGLIQGSDGNLYGAASSVIFKVTPAGGVSTFRFLMLGAGESFHRLLQVADGGFYLTTFGGETWDYLGSIFRIAPAGAMTRLHQSDYGSAPCAGLIQGTDGHFYGTQCYAYYVGQEDGGTLFRMTVATAPAVISAERVTGGPIASPIPIRSGVKSEAASIPLKTGSIVGDVRDVRTNAPVSNALLKFHPGGASATTDRTGRYALTLPAGTYTVTVSATGSRHSTRSGIVVVKNATTTLDLRLSRPPARGSVLDVLRFETGSAPRPGLRLSKQSGPAVWKAKEKGDIDTLGWEIEAFGGASFASQPSGGTGALPPAGTEFITATGQPSRRVSSWYFGDGAQLLNGVNQAMGVGQQITPLDAALNASLVEGNSGAGGVRVSRMFTPRLAAELTVEFSRARAELSNDAATAIENSRVSFLSAWNGLASAGQFVDATVTSVSNVQIENGRQTVVTGALTVALKKTGKAIPYITLGAGVRSHSGTSVTVGLVGDYRFALGGTPFHETDSVTVRYSVASHAMVGVLGAGLKYMMSPRVGLRFDYRMYLGANSGTTSVDSNPVVSTMTPSGSGASATTPGIQFSNDYSFGIESSLSGPPIADFRAFTGSGVQRYDRLTIGMLWRF